jgi:glycosyltransferase involved in cell wall biosynthesis
LRILLANYRYFVSSGPERYLFNVTRRLEALGHTVMPYSINYAQNEPSDYSDYFASPLAGADEVFFDEHRRSVGSTIKSLSRLFYSKEVERGVGRLVDDGRPDVAYILYYLRKLSPSLLVGIKQRGVPIIARISDYGMMCGEHHMLRDEQPCTLCLDRGIHNSVRYRCVKGSLAISAMDAVATTFHRARGYFDLIDQFVTTNAFMSDMMVRSGISPNRISCIETFTDTERFHPGDGPRQPPYLLYVGRLDRPKGVHLLIDAMARLRDQMGDSAPTLKIAGSGHDAAYVEMLHARLAETAQSDRVEMLGAVDPDQVAVLYRSAYCTVMPALWYENLPNSVIESFASGCPVVAANLGSLSATVTDGVDGLHHRPNDAADLAAKLMQLLTDRPLRDRLALGARATAERSHSPDGHIARLMTLFETVRRPATQSSPDSGVAFGEPARSM